MIARVGLLLCLSVLLASGCKKTDVPQGTLKVALSEPGKAQCANQSVPTMENGSPCEIIPGDIIVSAEYMGKLIAWGIDKQKEINNLKSQLRTCH
jgi:hypothetical protein